MRSYGGYGSYRGRNRGRTALKVLIAVLLAVLILVVVGFLLLEPYIVYTGNGVRLDLPFSHRDGETPAVPTPEVSLPLVVITPAPTPTPAPETFRAVALPRSALTDGTAAGLIAAAGGNAAVFDMKADDGSLGYVSDLERARTAGASAADPGLNEAIRALNQGALHTVARVSCFRDNKVPYQDNTTAIRTSAGNWRDGGGIRWMSPARASARAYVIGVCRELCELGFDEIVLDHCAFPTDDDGDLSYIRARDAYPSDKLSQVEGFYRELRAALAEYPEVKLSLITGEAVLNGDAADPSGQTAAQLAVYADRVWAPLAERNISDYAGALEAAGMENAAARLVLLTDALPAGETGNWALLEVES